MTSVPESKLTTSIHQNLLLAKMFLSSEYSVQRFETNPLTHQMYASKEYPARVNLLTALFLQAFYRLILRLDKKISMLSRHQDLQLQSGNFRFN